MGSGTASNRLLSDYVVSIGANEIEEFDVKELTEQDRDGRSKLRVRQVEIGHDTLQLCSTQVLAVYIVEDIQSPDDRPVDRQHVDKSYGQ
jgi:hypothetical protein